jgi:hypothetical protein
MHAGTVMNTLENLIDSAQRREALHRKAQVRDNEERDRCREQREVQKVREVSEKTFSPNLLRQLRPKYVPSRGNFRAALQFTLGGVNFKLNFGEFLWAEPGRQDYLEGRNHDGHAVQFCPDFPDNDEKLAVLIDSHLQRRNWFRWLIPTW